jgi:hypothetical protein
MYYIVLFDVKNEFYMSLGLSVSASPLQHCQAWLPAKLNQPFLLPAVASCTHLTTQQVQYIAQHLSSLLLLPEVRQALTKLPPVLLVQLLSCEALEVDQVRSKPPLVLQILRCTWCILVVSRQLIERRRYTWPFAILDGMHS